MELLKADTRNPFMGLNNKVCEKPKYLCRLHQVWLSVDDVKRKRCANKPTWDMIGVRLCTNLSKRELPCIEP